jgi:hypothetical protein
MKLRTELVIVVVAVAAARVVELLAEEVVKVLAGQG